jgi:hypothetical protein
MTQGQQPVHLDDFNECWPSVSIIDKRSPETRRRRPFGSKEWNPTDEDNMRIRDDSIAIRNKERGMAERDGRDWRGLGPRQYAYRLKAAGFVFEDPRNWKEGKPELTKAHFARVEEKLGLMRRDPRIDFSWEDVADGRGIEHTPYEFQNNAKRLQTLEILAAQMSHIRLEGQKIVPELYVETEGLYNLVYDIADHYGARARALQGQSSITARYRLAERVAKRWFSGKVRTRVLCVVDYDKAGDQIAAAVAADAGEHLRDMQLAVDKMQMLQVNIVALTKRQCDDRDIPLVEKEGRLVQEAEALPTDILRTEIDDALQATLDMELFASIAKDKQSEIDTLARKIRRLRL